MNLLEKELKKQFLEIPQDAAPGFCLQVAFKGKKIIDMEWGKTWKIYDLASLTKIIFTTVQWMRGVSDQTLDLDQSVSKYLPWYLYSSTGRKLLSHSAGNDWWRPFYKDLYRHKNIYEKKQALRVMIRNVTPLLNTKAVYSDIDFFLLGFILEEVYEKPLLEIWEEFLKLNLPKSELHFNFNNNPIFKRQFYAPTEKCSFRKKILQGEVHDENTWALGGVSSHAGLFGTTTDVLEWGLWLRDLVRGESPYIKKTVAQEFFKRSLPTSKGDWALGFMLPTEGAASCGKHFSSTSVGHTGFTGTSFWMDLEKDLLVVLLSNRVHPTRKNELFRKERAKIHDAVVETLKRNL